MITSVMATAATIQLAGLLLALTGCDPVTGGCVMTRWSEDAGAKLGGTYVGGYHCRWGRCVSGAGGSGDVGVCNGGGFVVTVSSGCCPARTRAASSASSRGVL